MNPLHPPDAPVGIIKVISAEIPLIYLPLNKHTLLSVTTKLNTNAFF